MGILLKKEGLHMNYFCTLFDSNYLIRGLTMYKSIIDAGENFQIYVVCFDDVAFEILQRLSLRNITLISLHEFENEDLLKVKKTRTKGEYCWTCTSFVIGYVLDTYKLSEVTYLDADLYFFNKPSILLDEFRDSDKSVMITEHRYTPEYDQSATSGIYCVQFMTFKADQYGIRVLQWWQERCLEWCYARIEDGKFGDQKYLDDWTERFACVHVLQHPGGGVAPWNVQQYNVDLERNIGDNNIVFYHFHNLKMLSTNKFDMGTYRLREKDVEYIYYPYIDALKKTLHLVQEEYNVGFTSGIQEERAHWKNPIRKFKRKWRGIYNVVQR